MSTITTERLILRPFTETDADKMFKSWTWDERVSRYCRWHPHKSVEETQVLLNHYLQKAKNGFDFRWGIELKSDRSLIGIIDVVDFSHDNRIVNVGYNLAFEHWHKGYATEALKSVIKHLFNNGVEKIIAEHHIDNPASGRVMEKCDMRFIKLSKTQAKFDSDTLCDVKVYEIIKTVEE